MDWIKSALSDSDEEEGENVSKNNLKDKNNDNFKNFVQETVPFPKVLESTETVIQTTLKQTENDKDCSKELKNQNFSNKNTENENFNEDKVKSVSDFPERRELELKNSENSLKDNKNLFSIETNIRKLEKFDKVKIKSQELSESDLKELSQLKSSNPDLKLFNSKRIQVFEHSEQPVGDSKLTDPKKVKDTESYEETLDYQEALDSFNKSNVNFDKLLKSNQWLGPKVKIKDIKEEDLLLSQIEKDRNYTCNKDILYEGSKRFNLPTRLMETEDGQVITTNVARRTQKRKHQINWLAMEAQDKEMEIMEQTAHMRKSKRETQMKYGW